MAQQEEQRPLPPVHLVILQHGLWGSDSNTSNLDTFLRQHLRPTAAGADSVDSADATPETAATEVQVLNSDVNRKALTYDGIDVCGARVVKLVLDTIQQLQQQGRQVSQLSLIGYSLGGLILRYAVGKLYILGLFEEVGCANFITIATPHLGSWRSPTSFWARFFNSHVAVVGSRTGRQLMLVDADYSVPWLTHQQELHEQAHAQHTGQSTPGTSQQHTPDASSQPQPQRQQPQQQQPQQQAELPPGVQSGDQAVPLLLLMAHPAGPFHKALAGFKTRMVAANGQCDAMVPYCTAALCMSNPYEERLAVPISDRYPSVVRPAAVGEAVTALTYRGRTKRLFLFALFSPLAPLLYVWTVTYGLLHHRSTRNQQLEGSSWLQQQPAAGLKALRPSLTSSSSSSSRRLAAKQQPSLLLGGSSGGGKRTAATLAAAGGGGGDSAAVEDSGDAASAAGSSSDGVLIGTAVDEVAGEEGVPVKQCMQPGAAPTTAEADSSAVGAAAAAAGEQGVNAAAAAAGGAFSRRRSDSLAAVVAHHQQEDELGQLLNSAQLNRRSSSGAKKLPGLKPAAADPPPPPPTAAAAAVESEAVGGAAAAAAGKQRVTVDRDGIVEAPHLLHQQQAWMAAQLFDRLPPCHLPDNSSIGVAGAAAAAAAAGSDGALKQQQQPPPQQQQQQPGGGGGEGRLSEGGWHRVDVCTRHWHAHAAIIIRDSRFTGQSTDVFQYIVDHMSLA